MRVLAYYSKFKGDILKFNALSKQCFGVNYCPQKKTRKVSFTHNEILIC